MPEQVPHGSTPQLAHDAALRVRHPCSMRGSGMAGPHVRAGDYVRAARAPETSYGGRVPALTERASRGWYRLASPDYDFKDLSPYDFEVFVRDLLSRHDGITYSTYAIGRDGGIDLRARTSLGAQIAQCKHTPDASRGRLLAYAKKERGKLLAANLSVYRYVFITSADISPSLEEELRIELSSVASVVEVHGRGWLNSALSGHVDLERRHFKLWLRSSMAIREMLRGGIFLRGESRINKIRRNYLKFVHHEACDAAARALESSGIVIISGSPGAGKTAMAEYLVLQWWRRGYRVIVDPRTVDSWWEWLEDETPTIFFFDDAWGQTRLNDNSASHHDRDFAEFLTSIIEKRSADAKVGAHPKVAVVTSRSLILHDASRHSDPTHHLLTGLPESVVHVGRLPAEVRSRILFNHINAEVMSQDIRADLAVDDWWLHVSGHLNYSPRIVELVTARNDFTSGHDVVTALKHALDDPRHIWQRSFNSFSSFEQLLLCILAISPSGGVPFQRIAARLHVHSMTDLSNAISRLVGNWVELSHTPDGDILTLSDPSQRDFLIHHLSRDAAACLDVVKNSATIEDLAIMCERGRPAELEYQPSLFGEDEDSLRESLDKCAGPLIRMAREMLEGQLSDLRRDLSEDDFSEVFSQLSRILVFQADRYAADGVDASDVGTWFEESMSKVFALLDAVSPHSFRSVFDAIEEMVRVLELLTKHRTFPNPYDELITGAWVAIARVWEEWDGKILEKAGEQRFGDDLHDAVIINPWVFAELGLTDWAADFIDLEYLDSQFAEQVLDSPNSESWGTNLHIVEEMFECSFPEARKAIRELEDGWDESVPQPLKGPLARAPIHQSASPGDRPDGLRALFRSLADPLDAAQITDSHRG